MTTKDRILKINPDEIGVPQGAYRVELLDRHTGRVKDRIESKNYLTPMYLNALKWWNAAQFQAGLRWVHLGAAAYDVELLSSVWMGQDMSIPPRMPNEAMVSLSSAVAENTASHWATGRVLGYGTRWKAGSVPASGPRGQINEAQSELGVDSLKLVWDFNENQGNGAFNSLAIANINNVSYHETRIALTGSQWADGEKPYLNVPFPNTVSPSYFYPTYIDSTKIYYIDVVSTTMHVRSALKADFVDMGNWWDGSGVSLTTEVTLNGISWTSSNSSSATVANSTFQYQLWKDGSGNWYMCYAPRYARLNISKWNSAGTKQWTTQLDPTITTTTGGNAGCCVIGSNVYACFGSAGIALGTGAAWQTRVYRFDTTTGALNASFDLGRGGAWNLGGITTDGTDLFIDTLGGLEQWDTAGTFIENYGSYYGGSYTETGASPWSVTSNYQGSSASIGHRAYMFFDAAGSPQDRMSGNNPSIYTPSFVFYEGGKLWSFSSSSPRGITNTSGGVFPIGGGNCWSRSVLGSEVTKSVSSTMKWTYELTFPSEWRDGISHLALPA